jgi:hypothetical protein
LARSRLTIAGSRGDVVLAVCTLDHLAAHAKKL